MGRLSHVIDIRALHEALGVPVIAIRRAAIARERGVLPP